MFQFTDIQRTVPPNFTCFYYTTLPALKRAKSRLFFSVSPAGMSHKHRDNFTPFPFFPTQNLPPDENSHPPAISCIMSLKAPAGIPQHWTLDRQIDSKIDRKIDKSSYFAQSHCFLLRNLFHCLLSIFQLDITIKSQRDRQIDSKVPRQIERARTLIKAAVFFYGIYLIVY